jgi:hypothetical protein
MSSTSKKLSSYSYLSNQIPNKYQIPTQITIRQVVAANIVRRGGRRVLRAHCMNRLESSILRDNAGTIEMIHKWQVPAWLEVARPELHRHGWVGCTGILGTVRQQ